MKDLLVLKTFGYQAIALGGEGNRLPEKILDYLKAKYPAIIIFYDSDEPGIKYAKRLSDEIEAPFIYIPTEFPTKDISDYREEYGEDNTRILLNSII